MVYWAGISVRLYQPPFTYPKKSWQGEQMVSKRATSTALRADGVESAWATAGDTSPILSVSTEARRMTDTRMGTPGSGAEKSMTAKRRGYLAEQTLIVDAESRQFAAGATE
jgi:hypothetical protein